MHLEDGGSSQGESITQVGGAGERDFFPDPRDVSVEKLERNEEEARLANTESLRIETVGVAADQGVQSSVICRDLNKAGVNVPCLENLPLSLPMKRLNL